MSRYSKLTEESFIQKVKAGDYTRADNAQRALNKSTISKVAKKRCSKRLLKLFDGKGKKSLKKAAKVKTRGSRQSWTPEQDAVAKKYYTARASGFEIVFQLKEQLGIERSAASVNQRLVKLREAKKLKSRPRKASHISKSAVAYFTQIGEDIGVCPMHQMVDEIKLAPKKPQTLKQKAAGKKHFGNRAGGLPIGFHRVAKDKKKLEELTDLFALAIDAGYTLPDLHEACKAVG